MINSILRLPAVRAASGYPRSTLYLRVSQGLWTKAVRLGPRCVGWPEREVEAILQATIAGKSDAEIRKLVVRLESGRSSSEGGE